MDKQPNLLAKPKIIRCTIWKAHGSPQTWARMSKFVCLFTSQNMLVPNYTAWWQRHMYISTALNSSVGENWSRDLLILSPAL